MPIRGLDEYLNAKGLIKTEPLSNLENLRIGVDSPNWLRGVRCNEQNQVATGGVPVTLQRSVLNETFQFKANNIIPLWVFSGIRPQIPDRPSPVDARAQKWEAAWDLYQNGKFAEASATFQSSLPSDKSLASYFAPQVMKYLMEAGEQVFCSPMQTWPQLAHFLTPTPPLQPIIHAIWGPSELLLYGVKSVITSIDWNEKTFKYVEYDSILSETGLTPERFFEACVLSGFEGCSQTPIGKEGFQAYIEYRSIGNPELATLLGADTPRFAHYLRNSTLARLFLILDLKGETRPYDQTKDFSQFQTIRRIPGFDVMMPESIYWLISQGVISPQVVNVFLSGVMVETNPLVDSPSYRTLLDDLMETRSRTLALLAASMPSPANTKAIATWRWFAPDAQPYFNHSTFKNFSKQCGSRWWISDVELCGELVSKQLLSPSQIPDLSVFQIPPHSIHHRLLQQQQQTSIQLNGLIAPHVNISLILDLMDPSKSKNSDSPHPNIVCSSAEIQASVLTLTLESAQYLSYGRNLSDWGKALKAAGPAYVNEVFIALELLKRNHLHGNPLHPTTSVAENDPEISLIARVFSMIQMNLVEKWTGPIDRELTAFNSLVRATYRTARNLVEMALVSVAQAGRLTHAHEYQNLSLRLPWSQESNTALGVVITSFLLEDLPDFTKRFQKCPSLKQDIMNGLAFWNDLMKSVESLHASPNSALLSPELYQLFKSATAKLESQRADLLK